MVTSVTAKSNHYETLGLPSTASTEEIGKAYAAQMTTFRLRPENALTRLALLSTAYETLRDPAKRRAYDASLGLLGLNAGPVMEQKAASPFIGVTTSPQFNRPLPAPSFEPVKEPTRRAEPDPRVGSFIAASLRPAAPKKVEREMPVRQAAEPVKSAPQPVYVEPQEQEAHARIHRDQAMIAAGIVGLAILGIATALPRVNADRLAAPTVQARQAVTVGLPPATPAQDAAVGAPIEASGKAPVPHEESRVETAAQTAAAPAADSLPADQQSDQAAPQQGAADPLAPVSTDASAQPASGSTVADTPAESCACGRNEHRRGDAARQCDDRTDHPSDRLCMWKRRFDRVRERFEGSVQGDLLVGRQLSGDAAPRTLPFPQAGQPLAGLSVVASAAARAQT